METENKIIKYLIENKKEMTIRELANAVKSDYKIVHTAVNRLFKKEILSWKNIGKSVVVSFNNKLSNEIFQAELERRADILKNKNLKVMLDSIKNNLKTVNFVLLLFGSYAKKTFNSKSDIDLIFIIPDLKIEKEIEQSVSLLPLKIHSLVFSEKQFIDMKNSRELNVAKEAIKNNILLYGIEQYYELLEK
jgi:predicted nucleotidyltransferase